MIQGLLVLSVRFESRSMKNSLDLGFFIRSIRSQDLLELLEIIHIRAKIIPHLIRPNMWEPGDSTLVDFQDAFERLDSTIKSKMEALNAPGLAIGLTDRDRLLFVGNYGLANRDAQTPVTSETLFQIGSISKAFTSIVLLQLQEEGLLHLDDPISHHLPWFEVQSEYAPITLRHLMSHTAGIIIGADSTTSAFTETWELRFTRVTSPPGERFHYSNSGYKALGLVLQRILRQQIADILRQRVLAPLGMTATEPVITTAIRSLLAVGYDAFYDDRPLPRGGKLAPATWLEMDTADGAISSNAEDMCCYLRFILNQGNKLLGRKSFDQLIEPLIPTSDNLHGEHYGLGLTTRLIDGHRVIGHSGGMVGYTADLLADLEAGLGVIVLTNGPGNPEKISQYALSTLRNAQERDESQAVFMEESAGFPVEDYAGTYQCGGKVFTLTPENGRLYFEYKGDSVLMEPRDPDVFLVPHPVFELFLLRFMRDPHPEGEESAKITEVLHGPDVYLREGTDGPLNSSYPPEWDAYPGHYRSHNPWYSNIRVVLRKGKLILIEPQGDEEPLHPLEPGLFRVGVDSRSPEFIRFEVIVDGQAILANLSGGAYSRTFTP